MNGVAITGVNPVMLPEHCLCFGGIGMSLLKMKNNDDWKIPRTLALINEGAENQNLYISKLIALCKELELELWDTCKGDGGCYWVDGG